MKQTFKISAIDEDNTKVEFNVKIIASKYVLTSDEQKTFKKRLQNEVHKILKDSVGYNVTEIRVQ